MRLRISLLGVALLIASCGTGPDASSAAFPKLSGRVVDDAHVLSDAARSKLVSELAALEAETGDQLVVATVRSLGDLPIEEFANRLAREWRVGQSDKDNGILLIVAPVERKVRIEVGEGIEYTMTDWRASKIIRETMLPLFRAGRIEEGVVAGSEAVVRTMLEQRQLETEAA